MADILVQRDGLSLAGERTGDGVPVVLAHGLTATRRYVVMGSSALQRSGHEVVAYDARGHGASSPASDRRDYGYDALTGDLVAVLDACGIDRAVLAGASMGAHTILALALSAPARVAGLVVITPGHDPAVADEPERLRRWDELADGLENGGVEGFLAAYGEPEVPESYRETVIRVIRQRLAEHHSLTALADALRWTPRSHPFEAIGDLAAITAPCVVVASRDEPDPGHPLAVGEAYAEAIPGARLVVESPGESPVAWRGGTLSKVIAELAAQTDLA